MSVEQDMLAIRALLQDAMRIMGRYKKRLNAHHSREKAKANGKSPGRKKLRDDEQIRALRKTGLSIRGIAKVIGLSTAAVQRGLKE